MTTICTHDDIFNNESSTTTATKQYWEPYRKYYSILTPICFFSHLPTNFQWIFSHNKIINWVTFLDHLIAIEYNEYVCMCNVHGHMIFFSQFNVSFWELIQYQFHSIFIFIFGLLNSFFSSLFIFLTSSLKVSNVWCEG